MTATIDEAHPERAWGVASVPISGAPSGVTPADRPPGNAVVPISPVPVHPVPVSPVPFIAAPVRPVATDTGLLPTSGAPPAGGPRPASGAPSAGGGSERSESRLDRHRKPARKPLRRWLARLRTLVVVLALLAGAGFGGYHVIQQRLADQAFVDLGAVVLTAEAVPVGLAEAVVVTQVAVAEQARVTPGQVLAVVTTAIGGEETLRAPVAGTVAAVRVGVGGVARGGEPIVTLYDQARLTFQSDVSLEALHRLRLGMTTSIGGPGLAHPITATLDHVVPVVGANQSTGADRLTVVLVPVESDRATVSTLVPGLRFQARVDTNTAPTGVPAVNTE